MKDELKIVYNSLDDNIACIHVLRRQGRGYVLVNDITENATEIYKRLIGKNITERIKRQKEFLLELQDSCVFDLANSIEETDKYIIAYTDFGKKVYSKKALAKFWLTHSNDLFFKTFGFSWVPSDKLQSLVRSELNNMQRHHVSNISIGVDLTADVPLIPKSTLEDIVKSSDFEDSLYKSIHMGLFK